MSSSLTDGRLRRLLVIDQEAHAIAWVRSACGNEVEVRVQPALELGVQLAASFRPDAIVIAASLFEFEQASASVVAVRAIVEQSIASLRSPHRSLPILVRCSGDQKSTLVAIAVGTIEGVDVISVAMGETRLRERIAMIKRQRERQRYPRVQVSRTFEGAECRLPLLGHSPAMLDALKAIGVMSRVSDPLLITGEVGTGKRSVARCIHEASDETSKSFHLIDAVANDPHAIEEFLFERGEPESVSLNRSLSGTVVIAHTEFLTARLQAMLASVFRVGIFKTRVILTTANPAPLWPDLRFPLQGGSIDLPPLRARGDDIEILICHFAEETLGASIDSGSVQRCVTPSALNLLRRYSWPGNLSELRSVICRELRGGRLMLDDTETLRGKLGNQSLTNPPIEALGGPHSLADSHLYAIDPLTQAAKQVMTEKGNEYDRLTRQLRSENFWRSEVAGYAASLPPAPEMGMLLGEATEAVETGLIAAALESTRGNIAQSARLLGITRVSLRRKIQVFQLNVPGRAALP